MLNFSVPLLIVAIGGMFSSRSGVLNIALDGIMIFGALAGFMFIRFTEGVMAGQAQLVIAIFISIAAGVLFSLLHAFASINLNANQIISGQAMNMLAPAFSIFICRIFFHEQMIQFKNTFIIREIPVFSTIPVLGGILFKDTYITTFIGIFIPIIAAFLLLRTRFGLRLRACGEFPHAPDSVGISVYKMRYWGVLISGGLAGLGGLVYVIPNSTNFNASVSGYGFLAFAVMILGQWLPGKICLASVFFGLMKTLSAIYSGIPILNTLGIAGNIYKLTPYLIMLLVLLFSSKNSMGPKAEGQPFEKGAR
jgi:simple sugar transport system permease protein